METVLIVLLVLMIPGLLSYLLSPEQEAGESVARDIRVRRRGVEQ